MYWASLLWSSPITETNTAKCSQRLQQLCRFYRCLVGYSYTWNASECRGPCFKTPPVNNFVCKPNYRPWLSATTQSYKGLVMFTTPIHILKPIDTLVPTMHPKSKEKNILVDSHGLVHLRHLRPLWRKLTPLMKANWRNQGSFLLPSQEVHPNNMKLPKPRISWTLGDNCVISVCNFWWASWIEINLMGELEDSIGLIYVL